MRGGRSGLEDSSRFSGAGPGKRPQEGGSRLLVSGSGRQGSQGQEEGAGRCARAHTCTHMASRPSHRTHRCSAPVAWGPAWDSTLGPSVSSGRPGLHLQHRAPSPEGKCLAVGPRSAPAPWVVRHPKGQRENTPSCTGTRVPEPGNGHPGSCVPPALPTRTCGLSSVPCWRGGRSSRSLLSLSVDFCGRQGVAQAWVEGNLLEREASLSGGRRSIPEATGKPWDVLSL